MGGSTRVDIHGFVCVGWPLSQERGRSISEIYSMNPRTTQKIWNMDWLRQGCHAFEVVSLRHHGIFARESPCSMPRPGCCRFQPMPKPFLLWCFGRGIWHSLSELWSPCLGGGFIFFFKFLPLGKWSNLKNIKSWLNHQLVILKTRIPIESHAKNQSRIHHVYTGRILFFLCVFYLQLLSKPSDSWYLLQSMVNVGTNDILLSRVL